MSVLVEALSVIVARSALDSKLPGGADAYLAAARAPESPARFAVTDEELTSVSFLTPEEATRFIETLVEQGLVESEEGGTGDIAFVDQHYGPSVETPWIEWAKHDDGFTYCWLAGREPGDVAVPEGWSPAQSMSLVRHDIRDEPGRMMRLAEEDGLEIWLDFKTGRQIAAVPHQPGTTEEEPGRKRRRRRRTSIMATVKRALDEQSWRYAAVEGAPLLTFNVLGERATYPCWVAVNEDADQCTAFVVLPHRVPEDKRSAMSELLTRINYGLAIGNLEMDFADGELRFRASIDVEGGRLSPRMVQTMFTAGLWTFDRFHDALMRVMYAGASAADALDALEDDEEEEEEEP